MTPIARRHVAALAWLLVVACSRGPGAERQGDEAYSEGRYPAALALYRDAVGGDPAARLWAKVGAAALRTGELEAATDAYLRLAGEDPTRADEAAEGLAMVAESAERANNERSLRLAVTGLDVVAPERITGRFALALLRRSESGPADLVRMLPRAIAAASHPRSVDSLLTLYAAGLRETEGCEAALPVYRAVVRRSREQALVAAADQGITECVVPWLPPELTDSTIDTIDTMGVP